MLPDKISYFYVTFLLILLIFHFIISSSDPIKVKLRYSEVLDQIALDQPNCLKNRLIELKNNSSQLYQFLPKLVKTCNYRKYIPLKGYKNHDETKYFWKTPYNSKNQCVIVTLGIGVDATAEMEMKNHFPECQFYGADPVESSNRIIFEEVGKYFKTAVGAINGVSNASLLKGGVSYESEQVLFQTLPQFLSTQVQQKIINLLLIDIEGIEYDIFHYFYKNSELDKSNTVICQFNIEMHQVEKPDFHLKIAEFLEKIVEEQIYFLVDASTFLGNYRMYFTRLNHKDC